MGANDLSLLILQLAVGLTFAAHGAQKVFGWWGGPGMTAWEGAMAHMGFDLPACSARCRRWSSSWVACCSRLAS